MFFRSSTFCALLLLLAGLADAQVVSPPIAANTNGIAMNTPERLQVEAISVEGIEGEYSPSFIQQISGLTVGQSVMVPGDPAFADAIRSLYRLGMFSDVKITEERRVGDRVFLTIHVREVPKLADYQFSGIKKRHRKDLREEVPLLRRQPLRTGSVERAVQVIEEFFAEKGQPLATVDVVRTENPDNTIGIDFLIERGPKVEVGDVIVQGNEELSDRAVRKAMETKEDKWWRFWKKAKLDEDQYESDLQAILTKYKENGYYDARIVKDSVALVTDEGKPYYAIYLDVEEGNQYHIRNVEWDGNTVYPDGFLTERLGLTSGDTYNGTLLDENLRGNRRSTDVSSLYLNQGYMRFNAEPQIRVVGEDSLDIYFDVFEGDVYRFGNIDIAGNRKTREHVIRRELYTVPGQTFSRESIQESVRRLLQLNYFTQESLAPGPGININEEEKSVDLAYDLEETGTDQLELSGTWGRFGLVLQLRFTFNNFSSRNMFKKGGWRPVPTGDGQKLSVGVQTNGRFYQQYSLSFTEPWFRGKPQPVGFSLSFSKISQGLFTNRFLTNDQQLNENNQRLITSSANLFYERRLKVPDDFFSFSTGVGYQFFDNQDWISTLPEGISQEISLRTGLSRNSTNHPFFPTQGSKMSLSLETALPIANLIQYHKWRFTTSWNASLFNKIALGVGADYGYIGSLTGEDVEFERFVVGGSPFETSGSFFSFFGKEVIYMRGYPLAALGPRRDNDPQGGRVLNRYATELRWTAVQSEQLQAVPYLFAEAANTFDDVRAYNPSALYRSAGVGARLFLPILGMVELVYGYNFDTFDPINNDHDGSQKWTFQFSLGQGFGF